MWYVAIRGYCFFLKKKKSFENTDKDTEHLAALLTKDDTTAGQFQDSFIKVHSALSSQKNAFGTSTSKNGSRAPVSLKPTYTCLDCSEVYANSERMAHTQKTEHNFCTA